MAEQRKQYNDDEGPDSAGQSGDLQQLDDRETASNESIEELVEEDVPEEYRNDQNRDVA